MAEQRELTFTAIAPLNVEVQGENVEYSISGLDGKWIQLIDSTPVICGEGVTRNAWSWTEAVVNSGGFLQAIDYGSSGNLQGNPAFEIAADNASYTAMPGDFVWVEQGPNAADDSDYAWGFEWNFESSLSSAGQFVRVLSSTPNTDLGYNLYLGLITALNIDTGAWTDSTTFVWYVNANGNNPTEQQIYECLNEGTDGLTPNGYNIWADASGGGSLTFTGGAEGSGTATGVTTGVFDYCVVSGTGTVTMNDASNTTYGVVNLLKQRLGINEKQGDIFGTPDLRIYQNTSTMTFGTDPAFTLIQASIDPGTGYLVSDNTQLCISLNGSIGHAPTQPTVFLNSNGPSLNIGNVLASYAGIYPTGLSGKEAQIYFSGTNSSGDNCWFGNATNTVASPATGYLSGGFWLSESVGTPSATISDDSSTFYFILDDIAGGTNNMCYAINRSGVRIKGIDATDLIGNVFVGGMLKTAGTTALIPVADTGWTANADAGDKTQVIPSTATISAMVAALNIVSSGLGTLIFEMAQKIKALESALASIPPKLPNA